MSELYWITRLDAIVIIFQIFTILSFVCILLFGMIYFVDEYIPKNIIKLGFKISVITLVISLPLQIFVPTTKDVFVIWGVGGTIDYLKSNEKVTQLPDKCIDALDFIIDEYEKKTIGILHKSTSIIPGGKRAKLSCFFDRMD